MGGAPNSASIQAGWLWTYTKNESLYKCPGDQTPNARSVAMSCYMGPAVGAGPGVVDYADSSFYRFYRLTDLVTPDKYFVILDERSQTINDGFFRVDMSQNYASINVADFPAIYHNKASAFSYADGHAGMHKWKGPIFDRPVVAIGTAAPNDLDAIWQMQHASKPMNADWLPPITPD